jgi:hypothetical protein
MNGANSLDPRLLIPKPAIHLSKNPRLAKVLKEPSVFDRGGV